jgi:hypothetical protein
MGFEWVPLKNYKRHYICLNCQKGFKRASKEDMKEPKSMDFSNLMEDYYTSGIEQDLVEYIKTAHKQLEVICPNCQGSMLQVHYDFEVPPRRDDNSWKKLRKTMSSQMILQYDRYIQWHRLKIQKEVVTPVELSVLKQNLVKLEKI